MMIIPLALGTAALVLIAGTRRAMSRHALPVDVAASLRAALATADSPQSATLKAMVDAIRQKHPLQARVIQDALVMAADPLLAPDVRGSYWATMRTGNPAQLKAGARAFEGKYHYLAARLTDMADVLAHLKGA